MGQKQKPHATCLQPFKEWGPHPTPPVLHSVQPTLSFVPLGTLNSAPQGTPGGISISDTGTGTSAIATVCGPVPSDWERIHSWTGLRQMLTPAPISHGQRGRGREKWGGVGKPPQKTSTP